MKIEVGQKAPSFTLHDSEKKVVSLEDYRGKNVVLLFFPAAFTGVCTKELCQARDEMSFYNDVNAEVLGISVDLPFALSKFKEMNNYTFSLLTDFNKEASEAYDVLCAEWILGLKGVSKRSAFVIDKDGIIRHKEVLENAGEIPDFQAVKTVLAGLK